MSTSCSVLLFFSGDSKQDAATTTAYSKRLIGLLKEIKVLASSLITIWGITDGCVDQYICSSVIYLMSVML